MAARKFYVYVFEQSGIIEYIGKGSGRRLKQQEKRFGYAGKILEWCECDDSAFDAERKWIEQLNPVSNLNSGGGGGRVRPKPETKEQKYIRLQWAKFEREFKAVGSRRYVARFLLKKICPANREKFGISAERFLKLQEVANGAYC